ncbi:MAG: DNA cytosine methyltransferase [Chloroflexi bacterium CFX1]|nr:DNA cytosine methyltransferase [Chloroflexi bacterium CFX1]
MKSVSLFSGIGGFDLGFQRAGIECVAVCEIDKNAQSVLTRRFPNAQLFDDVRKIGKETHERKSIDLVCGGFPCQDVSIAGKRAGLAGERSGLWFEFARIIDELEPQWVVIENVPGLLSSNGGKDFAVIIRWLAQRGYGVAWRVLDAQYFGVPQRRRRVFIVGSFGNGRAAEVLFESEGSEGNNTKGGEAGKEVAYSLRANASHSGDKDDGGINTTLIANTVQAQEAKKSNSPENNYVLAFGWNKSSSQTMSVTEKTGSLQASPTSNPAIWHNHQQDGSIRMQEDGTAPTVSRQWGTGGNNVPFVGVRRLMPIECERLQGFPDGWTDGQSDSTRYRQLGNAVAVPVIEWIGKRIMAATCPTQPAPDAWESAPLKPLSTPEVDSDLGKVPTPTKRR